MGALPVIIVATTTLVAIWLRRTRWAARSRSVSRWTYGIIVPLSLLYFPMKSGFLVRPVQCEWTFDWSRAIHSLENAPHMIGFAIFFLLSFAQIANTKRAVLWSFAACFAMGFLVEMAEGATGIHHCKMSDLIPDMTGAVIGAGVLALILAVRPRADGGGDRQSSRAEI